MIYHRFMGVKYSVEGELKDLVSGSANFRKDKNIPTPADWWPKPPLKKFAKRLEKCGTTVIGALALEPPPFPFLSKPPSFWSIFNDLSAALDKKLKKIDKKYPIDKILSGGDNFYFSQKKKYRGVS